MAQLIHSLTDEEPISLLNAPPKRCFFIYGSQPDKQRGQHRHRHSMMLMNCVRGSVRVYVQTPSHDQYFILDDSTKYLLLSPDDWRMMYDFTPDAILVVTCDYPYLEEDYIEAPYREPVLAQPNS